MSDDTFPPDTIFLQVGPDVTPDDYERVNPSEVTWCWDEVFSTDLRYVRATPARDAAEDMAEALKELCDLIDSLVQNHDYEPDSFTTQPGRLALRKAGIET